MNNEPLRVMGAIEGVIAAGMALALALGADGEIVAAVGAFLSAVVAAVLGFVVREKVTPYDPQPHPEAMADPDDPDIITT